MWTSAFTKHEAYKSCILKAIISLTSIMDHNLLRFILDKVRDTQIIDKDMIGLLKAISVRASAVITSNIPHKTVLLSREKNRKKPERANSPQHVTQKLQISSQKKKTFDDVDRIKI